MSGVWFNFDTDPCACGRHGWPPTLSVDMDDNALLRTIRLHWDRTEWVPCRLALVLPRTTREGRALAQATERACAEANAVPIDDLLADLAKARGMRAERAQKAMAKLVEATRRAACEAAIARLGYTRAASVAWGLFRNGWAGTPEDLVSTAAAVLSGSE